MATRCLQHLRKVNFLLFRSSYVTFDYAHYLTTQRSNLDRFTDCQISTSSIVTPSGSKRTTELRSKCIRKKTPLYLQESQYSQNGNAERVTDDRTTIHDILDVYVNCLAEQLIPEPRESVELFVAHVLGRPTLHGISPLKCLSQYEVVKVEEMVKMRLKRIPVQYILGEWDFCDLTLKMSPPVFIPRPETEELVAYIKSYLYENKVIKARLLEIGSGTGAITLALLKEFPQLQAVAIDKTVAACDLTMDNARRLGLQDRLEVLHRDITEDMSDLGVFDLMVSNPPYISTGDIDGLDLQVTKYEDMIALDGGSDGLDVVRQILKKVPSLLYPNGTVWLEVDTVHPHVVQDLLDQGQYTGLQYVKTLQDFTSRPRFCVLRHIETPG